MTVEAERVVRRDVKGNSQLIDNDKVELRPLRGTADDDARKGLSANTAWRLAWHQGLETVRRRRRCSGGEQQVTQLKVRLKEQSETTRHTHKQITITPNCVTFVATVFAALFAFCDVQRRVSFFFSTSFNNQHRPSLFLWLRLIAAQESKRWISLS